MTAAGPGKDNEQNGVGKHGVGLWGQGVQNTLSSNRHALQGAQDKQHLASAILVEVYRH